MPSATAFKSLHREPKHVTKTAKKQTIKQTKQIVIRQRLPKLKISLKKKQTLFHSHLLRGDAVSSKAGSWNNCQ